MMYREVDANIQSNSYEVQRDYAILPRRKAGQSVPLGERAPVLLTKSVLANYFGMPLSAAAKELVRNAFNTFCKETSDATCFVQGICATAIKKVCRKLGILKWPFRDRHLHARIEHSDHPSYPQSSADDSSAEANEPASPHSQPHRWSDFLTGKASSGTSSRQRLTSVERNDICSASTTPLGRDNAPSCRSFLSCGNEVKMEDSATDPAECGGSRFIVEEVDPSSSSEGAAASPYSDTDLNDGHPCSGDDEDGLLGSLVSGAAGLDDDVLGMAGDFYAVSGACARAEPGMCDEGAPWGASGCCASVAAAEEHDQDSSTDGDGAVRACPASTLPLVISSLEHTAVGYILPRAHCRWLYPPSRNSA